jgi:hypothetical protein|tara:strand:- start:237 stop:404 length:168 start_codon:yes stop_codon:yes gene_type:complete
MKIFLYTLLSTAVLSALAKLLLGSLGIDIASSVELIMIFSIAIGLFLYFTGKEIK